MADAGTGIQAPRGAWSFKDEGVAEAFDEHVSLSVPAYDEVQTLAASLVGFYSRPGDAVVDLGCATGRTLREVGALYEGRRLIGVDEAKEMLDVGRAKSPGVDFVEADLASYALPETTRVVLALYALQFLDVPAHRATIRNLAKQMRVGSALILVEKTVVEDGRFGHVLDQLYLDRKVRAGFEPAEVLGKAAALRGAMRPLPASTTEAWLKDAGFAVQRFWQSLAFVGWVAERLDDAVG